MTRIFTDGAEFNDTLFWTAADSFTSSSTQKRSGSYSYRNPTANVGAYKSFTAISEGYFRFCIYNTTSFYTSSQQNVSVRNSTTTHVSFYIASSDSKAHIDAGGSTNVATSTNSYNTGIWHLVEMYVKIADSPDGRVTVKIDGVQEIDYTGDVKNGSTTTFDNIQFNTNTTGGTIYIDDLALNDTSDSDGKGDNSWCGDGHIELLTPNGNGDTNDWTGSDGNSVDNYLLVDEYAYDSDTTYVKNSANQQDMYNLTDFTDTGKIVTRVYSECRAKDNDATSGTIKIGFKTDGTVYLCSSARVLSNTYARVVGDDAKVNPFDSGIWENADLDAIQFVVECSSSSSSSSTTSSSSSTNIP